MLHQNDVQSPQIGQVRIPNRWARKAFTGVPASSRTPLKNRSALGCVNHWVWMAAWVVIPNDRHAPRLHCVDTALRKAAAIEASQIVLALALAIARAAETISQIDRADVLGNGLNGTGSVL